MAIASIRYPIRKLRSVEVAGGEAMESIGTSSFPKTDQEERCEALFLELEKMFKKCDKFKKPDKIHAMLRDITNKLKEAKAFAKDFEREARADGMPAKELQDRKKVLVNQLNNYIATKKNYGAGGAASEGDHLDPNGIELGIEGQATTQLMVRGRKDIAETDQALSRAKRLVADTLQIGAGTAATLGDQTKQLNKLVDDLNEIEMDMKKATKIIGDITRGLLTDKCIGVILFLVVGGVIAIIVLKVIKPRAAAIASVLPPLRPGRPLRLPPALAARPPPLPIPAPPPPAPAAAASSPTSCSRCTAWTSRASEAAAGVRGCGTHMCVCARGAAARATTRPAGSPQTQLEQAAAPCSDWVLMSSGVDPAPGRCRDTPTHSSHRSIASLPGGAATHPPCHVAGTHTAPTPPVPIERGPPKGQEPRARHTPSQTEGVSRMGAQPRRS
ncbi:MAG: hypothetical protein WDW36_006335 [Sanguina aurantia]